MQEESGLRNVVFLLRLVFQNYSYLPPATPGAHLHATAIGPAGNSPNEFAKTFWNTSLPENWKYPHMVKEQLGT